MNFIPVEDYLLLYRFNSISNKELSIRKCFVMAELVCKEVQDETPCPKFYLTLLFWIRSLVSFSENTQKAWF